MCNTLFIYVFLLSDNFFFFNFFFLLGSNRNLSCICNHKYVILGNFCAKMAITKRFKSKSKRKWQLINTIVIANAMLSNSEHV